LTINDQDLNIIFIVFSTIFLGIFMLRTYKEKVRVKRSKRYMKEFDQEDKQYEESKDYNKDNRYEVKDKKEIDEDDPWASYDELWDDIDKKAGK
jgi:uncharacterized ion transporter superfamily protein YfcC